MSTAGREQDTRYLDYAASSKWVPTRVAEELIAVRESGFSLETLTPQFLILPDLTTQTPNGRLGLPNDEEKFGKLGYSAQGERIERDI